MSTTPVLDPHAAREVAFRLRPGTELLGAYEGSGLKEPPYLVRRGDGGMVQVSRLVHLVAASLDGHRTLGQVAERVTSEFGRGVSTANVEYLVTHRLVSLALVEAATDASAVPPPEADVPAAPLALSFKGALLPHGFVRGMARWLAHLFAAPIVVAACVGVVLLDGWLILEHGLGKGIAETVAHPEVLLALYLLLLLSMVFHEFGHAAACHRGGGRPGRIGVGIYLLWLVMYNDVTDSYRLGRADRLRTDLGGIYFNGVFALASAALWLATGYEPFLVLAAAEQLMAAYQLLPFVRFDGYYILSDLIGVPDLFSRMKPVLLSMVPGRTAHPAATALRRRARVVVTIWVVATAVALAAACVFGILRGPRIAASTWRSFVAELQSLVSSFGDAGVVVSLIRLISLAILFVPMVGVALIVASLSTRAWRGLTLLLRRAGPRQAQPVAARPIATQRAAAQPAAAQPVADVGRWGGDAPPAASGAAGVGLLWLWEPSPSGLLIPRVGTSTEAEQYQPVLPGMPAAWGRSVAASAVRPMPTSAPDVVAEEPPAPAPPASRGRRRGTRVVRRVLVPSMVVVAVTAALLSSDGPDRGSVPDGTRFFETTPARHVEGPIAYPETPPVAGDHAPVWLNCGIYASPIPVESAVHSMEHGAVWISYDADLPPDDVNLLRVTAATGSRGDEGYVILAPQPGLPAPVVATAWGRQLRLTDAADARLAQFIRYFAGSDHVPEPRGSCRGA